MFAASGACENNKALKTWKYVVYKIHYTKMFNCKFTFRYIIYTYCLYWTQSTVQCEVYKIYCLPSQQRYSSTINIKACVFGENALVSDKSGDVPALLKAPRLLKVDLLTCSVPRGSNTLTYFIFTFTSWQYKQCEMKDSGETKKESY